VNTNEIARGERKYSFSCKKCKISFLNVLINTHACLDAKCHLMVFLAISQVFSGTGSLVTLYEADLLPFTVPLNNLVPPSLPPDYHNIHYLLTL
jgi:hypothetical protein